MTKLTSEAAARVHRHIEGSIQTKRELVKGGIEPILEAARMMVECLASDGKILLCGNGGSAADAQHIAAEFVSVLNQTFPRPGLASIALTTDSSMLTGSGNDFGFAGVFERQVQALGRPGDVVVGISTSGNSENVLRALAYAKSHGMHAIGMTGKGGGKLPGVAHLVLHAPSRITQFIQESHIMMGHIICDLVEQSLDYDENGIASGSRLEKTS